MKKMIIKCDHCGKEVTEKNDWVDLSYEVVDLFENVDLCRKCVYELNSIVAKYVNRKATSKEDKDGEV